VARSEEKLRGLQSELQAARRQDLKKDEAAAAKRKAASQSTATNAEEERDSKSGRKANQKATTAGAPLPAKAAVVRAEYIVADLAVDGSAYRLQRQVSKLLPSGASLDLVCANAGMASYGRFIGPPIITSSPPGPPSQQELEGRNSGASRQSNSLIRPSDDGGGSGPDSSGSTEKSRGRPHRAAQQQVALNVMGTTQLLSAFAPQMAARGRGHFLVVSSVTAECPNPGAAVYAASKAYLRSLGTALRHELAPLGVGVTVALPGPLHGTGFFSAAAPPAAGGAAGKAATTANPGVGAATVEPVASSSTTSSEPYRPTCSAVPGYSMASPVCARQLVEATLRDKALVVPGALNKVWMHGACPLLPHALKLAVVDAMWAPLPSHSVPAQAPAAAAPPPGAVLAPAPA